MRTLPLFAIYLSWSTQALAAGITDNSTHTPPAVTFPSAGGSYVDPVFGTTIIRVTDSSDGDLCTHAYAYWPALNADNTRLLLACDDVPLLYKFNAATDTVTPDGELAGSDGKVVSYEGAYWSHSDPDIIYGLEGTRLWRIDVSVRGMDGYTLVRDFAGLFSYSYRLYQLQMAEDENIFTFHTRSSGSGDKLDAVAYDREADEVYIYDRGSWVIDETKVDKLGRYVMIDGDDGDFRIWDFRTDSVDYFEWGDPDDKPGGHVEMGKTVLINSDGWNTGLIARRYDALHGAENLDNIVQYKRPSGSLNWTIADHVSLRNDDETFVVASTYGGDGTYAAFEDEIYLAYIDGSSFVRLGHTRSKGGDGKDYFSEPRAVVDRFGRYIVFASDLGSSSRVDVMMLKIPSALWPPSEDPPSDPDAGPGPAIDAGMASPDAAVAGDPDAAVAGDIDAGVVSPDAYVPGEGDPDASPGGEDDPGPRGCHLNLPPGRANGFAVLGLLLYMLLCRMSRGT